MNSPKKCFLSIASVQAGGYDIQPFHQLETGFPLHQYSSKNNAPVSTDAKVRRNAPARQESTRQRSSSFPFSLAHWLPVGQQRRPAADKSHRTASCRTGLIASQRRRRCSPTRPRSAGGSRSTPQSRRRLPPSHRTTRSRMSSPTFSAQSFDLSAHATVVTEMTPELPDGGDELTPRLVQPRGGAIENLGLVCDELNLAESERELA